MLLSRRALLLLVALQLYTACAVYAFEANATCPATHRDGRLVQESLGLCWKNEAPEASTSTSSSESEHIVATSSVVPSSDVNEPVQTSSSETQLAAISSDIPAEPSTSSLSISTPISTSTSASSPTSTPTSRQESTVSSDVIPSETVATTRTGSTEEIHETPSVPDFPSFEEWKRRHLASAAAHKDGKRGSNHTNHTIKGQDVDKPAIVEEKEEKPEKKWSLQKAKDSILGHQAKQAPAVVVDADIDSKMRYLDGEALPPATQKILHPVPHAGSGDPALDPLISLRDRTNYASVDCSATLMRASKNIKSASSILSSKKDRYMLTPCSVKEKFVIVELCEEIQIDNIVLANLEFFSSMFKMFRITAGTSYPESTGSWQEIGTFRASNVRGMQVFRPQDPSRGGFYRYIRVDFLTHYGTEYYCPVSLLKVYGLTNLDAYRRDQEREKLLAEASEEELLQIVEQPEIERMEDETVYLQLVDMATVPILSVKGDPAPEVEEVSNSVKFASSVEQVGAITEVTTWSSSSALSSTSKTSDNGPSASSPGTTVSDSASLASSSMTNTGTPTPSLSASIVRTALATSPISDGRAPDGPTAVSRSFSSSLSSQQETSTHGTGSPEAQHVGSLDSPIASPSPLHTQESSADAKASERSPSLAVEGTALLGSTAITSPGSQSKTSPALNSIDLRIKSESSTKSTIMSPKAATFKPVSTKTLPPLSYKTVTTASVLPPAQNRRNDTRAAQPQLIYTHPQPNESIYGTIMKRLLALEVNSTLSTAYIEEHTRFVWESFRRIEEKLGGMKHSRGQQDQLLRRIMLDLDLHRARLEAERIELNAQINILSKEMVMEKRLGLVQMAGLVTLLFFVLLTRGSPSTPFVTISQGRPAITPVFPTRVPRHRPRSLIQQSTDGLPFPMSAREPNFRERRSGGPERRNGTVSTGVSRATSIKRSSRPSKDFRRPPQPPMSAHARSQSEAIASPTAYVSTPLSAPLLSLSPSASRSPHDLSEAPKDLFTLTEGLTTPASSVTTLQQDSPTGRSNRLGPVDSIKRKFKLLQASKATDTSYLSPSSPSSQTDVTVNGDRRRFFKLGRRRSTVGSLDTEGGKAWLSMSEGSGEEDNTDLARRSVASGDVVFMPSPDPSDAEPSEFQRFPS